MPSSSQRSSDTQGVDIRHRLLSRLNPAHAGRITLGVIAVVAVLVGAGVPTSEVSAEEGLTIINASAVSEFPEGFRFLLELESDVEIEEVVVRFQVEGRPANQYNYLDLENNEAGGSQQASLTRGEYFHRTNSRDRYSPPGTMIRYYFEITGVDGSTVSTPKAELLLIDARYEWDTSVTGPVTVYYHGPVGVRAESMAEAAHLTILNMNSLLGAEIDSPVRIVMYNNNAEMIGALAPRSAAISSELITEGQAFGEQDVVLLLGNGRRAKGTISHELTHVLVHRATKGTPLSVPLWLNEGLAEFGNIDQGISYDRYLEWAIDTNRTTPFESLTVFPGDPNLTLVAYGQSRSLIEFMIEKWGREKMAELMSGFNSGMPFEAALTAAYGVGTRDLDEMWRETVGAAPLPDRVERAVDTMATVEPTSVPLAPLTLAGAAASGAASSSEPAEAPDPQPGSTLESNEASPEAPAAEVTALPEGSDSGSSGGCSAPVSKNAPTDAASAGLVFVPLLAAAWIVSRRAVSRR